MKASIAFHPTHAHTLHKHHSLLAAIVCVVHTRKKEEQTNTSWVPLILSLSLSLSHPYSFGEKRLNAAAVITASWYGLILTTTINSIINGRKGNNE